MVLSFYAFLYYSYLFYILLIVTHELASIHRIADKIIFLHDGKMLFYGTLKEAKNSGIKEIETFFEIGRF